MKKFGWIFERWMSQTKAATPNGKYQFENRRVGNELKKREHCYKRIVSIVAIVLMVFSLLSPGSVDAKSFKPSNPM